MPKMYHPETQEIIDASGREVQGQKAAGFIVVGNRPEEEFLGKTREELLADEVGESEEE